MSRGGGVLIGTHTWEAGPDATRRNAAAIASLHTLSGVEVVNLQFRDRPHQHPELRTLAALPRDSNSLTRRAGPRKPVMVDLFDALAAEARARDFPYFCFTNTDIQISQPAIDWIREGEFDAYIFSRQNFDGQTGQATTIELAGYDVYAIRPQWWRRHRRRFRPYLAGEGVWDEVYTSIIMCYANAAIENRRGLVRHEAHPMVPIPSVWFGRYVQMLAAFDAAYFSIWCDYYVELGAMRAAGATLDDEWQLARRTFVYTPGPAQRAVQVARSAKWWLLYRLWRLSRDSRETHGGV